MYYNNKLCNKKTNNNTKIVIFNLNNLLYNIKVNTR